MTMQQEIEEFNREIHNLAVTVDGLQFRIAAKIAEVRKLQEMQRIAARAGISE